jgi:YidC/Oxa1 family membrane protein insertase
MTHFDKTRLGLIALAVCWLGPSPTLHAQGTPDSITLTTEHFIAQVSTENAGVRSLTLRDPRFLIHGKPFNVVTTNRPEYYPLAVSHIDGMALSSKQPWTVERIGEQAVRFRRVEDGVGIERKLEVGAAPYQLWVTTTLANRGDKPRKLTLHESTYHYVARAEESGGIPLIAAHSSATSSALCHPGEDLERISRADLSAPHTFAGSIRFAGVENVYFLNAIAAEGAGNRVCTLTGQDRGRDEDGKALGTLIKATLQEPAITLAPGERKTLRALAYMGPKTVNELERAGHSLREAINSGFFTQLADLLTHLLRLIHSGVANWGIAIILLTFLVKLALYPLTHKQMESMARMKELKPEMDRLNELYADDREKKGAAIMELYRKRGVNPMAGCFPVLLQLPIWFSLYASLSTNIELFHAPFALWWHDLSSPDPYFVLPLSLGVLMFVQQKMAPPAGADPLQAKMMLYVMPVMITSFMLFLPAGLCLYMFTNSALSILQQRVIEARLKNQATTSPSPSEVADKTTSLPDADRRRRGRK